MGFSDQSLYSVFVFVFFFFNPCYLSKDPVHMKMTMTFYPLVEELIKVINN